MTCTGQQQSCKFCLKLGETLPVLLLWSESTLTFESCGPREASWELAMRSPSLIEDVEKIARSVRFEREYSYKWT